MSTDITIARPARIGQATAVEQARSVAEVHAQITVARQLPRDVQLANRTALDSCKLDVFAAKAFFRYSRGGGQVSGPSVHLARELARCWGNVDYGIKELGRDDVHGQSEMLAYAWDMETNVRSSNTFIVPHKRDKTGGPVELVDMRDIYENNANNAARRVRSAILSVLPPWFTEAAITACRETIKNGGGVPLQQRIANLITGFAGIGIGEAAIVRKLDGRPTSKWSPDDVVTLGVIYTSIERGETTRDDEFPPDPIGTAEILGQTPPAPAPAATPAPTPTTLGRPPANEPPPADPPATDRGEDNQDTGAPADQQQPDPASMNERILAAGERIGMDHKQLNDDFRARTGGKAPKDGTAAELQAFLDYLLKQEPPAPPPITARQLTRLHTLWTKVGVLSSEAKQGQAGLLVGRTITSTKELTEAEAVQLIAALDICAKDPNPVTAYDVLIMSVEQQGDPT